MAKKVIDKATQSEVEVGSREAQDAVLRGQAVLTEPTQTVIRGDQVMELPTDRLAEAVDRGWALADEEEVRSTLIQRDETDLGSSLLGGAESALAGATLGGSTWLEAALGADPERMRARREGLGGLGSALEVAGAIAPALVTGGGSAAAGAARGATGLGRAALATPAGAVARVGLGAERLAGAALGTSGGLVRTAVPVVGRGAVEGFAAGVGAEIDESVLGEREITAERLLAAGAMGGLFGGAAGSVVPGLAAAGAGLGKVGIAPIRQVLGRASGMADDIGDRGLAAILANPTARQRWAQLNNLDLREVDEIADDLIARPDEIHRYLTQANQVTEELAGGLRPTIEGFRKARKIAIAEGSGGGRMRDVSRHLPDDLDALARIPSAATRQLDDLEAKLAGAMRAHDGGLLELSAADVRSVRAMVQEARVEMSAAARNASGKTGARQVATVSHNALDRLKQDIDGLVHRSSTVAPSRASQNTLDLLKPAASSLRGHLEDAATYGEAGARQATRNQLMSAAIGKHRDLGDSASRKLLDRYKPVDNADLLHVVRNSGRFAGATKTELFEDAIQAEVDYLEWAAKNLDLDDGTRAAIREQTSAARDVAKTFEAQRTKVRKLDILERWRVSQNSRSPSDTIFSGPGPMLAGLGGYALGGVPGAMLGGALGMLTKPHTMTRKMAAILARSNGSQAESMKAIGGVLRRLGRGAADVGGSAGRGAAEVAKRTLPQLGPDRSSRLGSVRDTAQRLAGNPGLLADALRKLTIDLDDDAPHLSAAVAAKAGAAVTYLAQHAPAGYDPDPRRGREPVMIDPIDLEIYERRVEGTTQPYRTLARISDGTLTAEHVEALKAVWPAEYDAAKTEIFAAVAAYSRELPLDVATQLSTLWEAPVDPTLELAGGIALAFAGTQPQQPGMPGAPQGGKTSKPPKLELDAGSYATPMDAATKASQA